MTDPNSPTRADVDQPRGLSKYVMSVSRALKRNRSSTASTSDGGMESSILASPVAVTLVDPSSSSPPDIITNPPTVTSREPLIDVSANRANFRFHSGQERARALFAKYGLTLEEDEWINPPREPVKRVERPIRMRVHRQCHRCQTAFGAERVCSNCQHERCRQCPRSPVKRSRAEREATAYAAAGGGAGGSSGIGVTDSVGGQRVQGRPNMAMPSNPQDLVRKPAIQRVHQYCHECEALFLQNATECHSCGHIPCTECPRETGRHQLHQRGHMTDEEADMDYLLLRQWKKPRVRVRWTCHACAGLFAQGSKTCTHCDHERCDDCKRHPPKKVKPPIDPDLLRSVEEKLVLLDAQAQGAGESSVSGS